MVYKKLRNKIIAIHPVQLTNGVTVYLEEISENTNSLSQDLEEHETNNLKPMDLFGGVQLV